MAKPSISVVLPAYNEQENIPFAVNEVYSYLKKNFSKFELIVVNDGSRDNTAQVVQKLAKSRPQLRLVSHSHNRRYGAALTSGFRVAKYNLVFYTDADCQFNIADLKKLLPLKKKYDIVAGYRLNRQDPLMRIFIAWVYNWVIRLSLDLKIRDVDCSFKLYHRRVFDSITLTSQTGLIDAEILVKAQRLGMSIGQVGVRHYPRVRGATIYEIGKRNKFFAFVRPRVVIDLLKEIYKLRSAQE